MRFRFKIRTLLIVVTVVAILIAYLARISTIENRRRYFVSDAYWYEIGTASINSYVSHSETHSLSWSRWIGTKLAGTGEETTAISVGFGADAEADEIKESFLFFLKSNTYIFTTLRQIQQTLLFCRISLSFLTFK